MEFNDHDEWDDLFEDESPVRSQGSNNADPRNVMRNRAKTRGKHIEAILGPKANAIIYWILEYNKKKQEMPNISVEELMEEENYEDGNFPRLQMDENLLQLPPDDDLDKIINMVNSKMP